MKTITVKWAVEGEITNGWRVTTGFHSELEYAMRFARTFPPEINQDHLRIVRSITVLETFDYDKASGLQAQTESMVQALS